MKIPKRDLNFSLASNSIHSSIFSCLLKRNERGVGYTRAVSKTKMIQTIGSYMTKFITCWKLKLVLACSNNLRMQTTKSMVMLPHRISKWINFFSSDFTCKFI